MFLDLVTDDYIIVCDDRRHFLTLKKNMEALFEVTLEEGAILRFLTLRIIQIPAGISIDQTDRIVETIGVSYFQDRDTKYFRFSDESTLRSKDIMKVFHLISRPTLMLMKVL
jgi:hypothetical protein